MQRGIGDRDNDGVENPASPIVRPLVASDLERCLALSTEAKWNQTAEDWKFLIEQARTYGVEIPGEGLVATTVAWTISETQAWINMVLVRADQRGRGLASQLLQACLADLDEAGLTPLLDATEMGERVYGKIGFSGTDKLVRMKRTGASSTLSHETPAGFSSMTNDDMETVGERDGKTLGVNRREFLASLQARRPDLAWVIRNDAGGVAGYVLGREGRVATQIGPIVAATPAEAEQLLELALAAVPADAMIDVPVRQETFIAGLKERGFEVERGFLRMGLGGEQLATEWPHYYAMAGPDFA